MSHPCQAMAGHPRLHHYAGHYRISTNVSARAWAGAVKFTEIARFVQWFPQVGSRTLIVVNPGRHPQGEPKGASEDLHCVDGILEGVGLMAGPSVCTVTFSVPKCGEKDKTC